MCGGLREVHGDMFLPFEMSMWTKQGLWLLYHKYLWFSMLLSESPKGILSVWIQKGLGVGHVMWCLKNLLHFPLGREELDCDVMMML